jgi:glycosyltransferase involved in cell wall biosynthesis
MRAGGASGGRRSGATFGWLRRMSDWWLLPDSYAGWAHRAQTIATRRARRGDVSVILSSSPPESVHLAACAVARDTRLPWVADFRDPWIPLAFRRPPTAWHRARQEALERRVLESADRITAASRTHAEVLARAVGAARAERVEHVPNGFEPMDALEPAPVEPERFVIAFTGTMAQQPETEILLEAVHDFLAHHPDARRRVRVRLAGPFEQGYQDRAVALGLTGIVEFLGPIAHGEARRLQRRADLLVLFKPYGPAFDTMVPGKLYEYADAGRPWAALLEPEQEAAELARRAGAAVLPPGKRQPLAAEIERRYQEWRAAGRAPDARPPWLNEYTRAALAARLADTLERARQDRS